MNGTTTSLHQPRPDDAASARLLLTAAPSIGGHSSASNVGRKLGSCSSISERTRTRAACRRVSSWAFSSGLSICICSASRRTTSCSWYTSYATLGLGPSPSVSGGTPKLTKPSNAEMTSAGVVRSSPASPRWPSFLASLSTFFLF